MKPETRTALDESIAYWEKNLKEYDPDKPPLMLTGGCALCVRFLPPPPPVQEVCELNGEKCPVFMQAGVYGCKNTPYKGTPTEPRMTLEIDFLKSLREE